MNAQNDTVCGDTLVCNGSESCDTVLDCVAGTPPSVDDAIGCTVDSCNEITDTIVNAPADASCNDGLFCNGVETCDPANDCTAGTPPIADDGVTCTDDFCDEALAAIVNTPNDTTCDDGDVCTGIETCDAVADCQAGTALVCDDANVCTDDACDIVLGCVTSDNLDACDDADPCTIDDACMVGTCAGTLIDCELAGGPGLPGPSTVTTDTEGDGATPADPVETTVTSPIGGEIAIVELTLASGAVEIEITAPTNTAGSPLVIVYLLDASLGMDPDVQFRKDGLPVEDCTGAPATADPDPCIDTRILLADGDLETTILTSTASMWDFGAVADCTDPATQTPMFDGTACDDGSACTDYDICTAGVCAGALIDCDNGFFCDGPETCDVVFGCQPPIPLDLDDGVDCTDDSCDETAGVIVHAPNHAFCDDALFCNGAETCHVADDCQAGTPPVMDDAVDCTVDSCDEDTDTLLHVPSDALCDDALFCNGTETCDAVADCQAGAAPGLDDGVDCTQDSCDETADAVVHTPDDANCDDGQFCNGAETCDPVAGCADAAPLTIDDGIGCTMDACDELADAVLHTPDHAICANSLFCDGDEICDPQLDCQASLPRDCSDGVACTVDTCNESVNACTHAPDHGQCSNGDACDGEEICHATLNCLAGLVPDCDDGNECTDDQCLEGSGCVNDPNTAACEDGTACTSSDTCSGGVCEGVSNCSGGEVCDLASDTCVVPADSDNDGIADPTDPCPGDPRNLCAGSVATDLFTGNPIRLNANVSLLECSGPKIDCNGDVWLADYGYNQSGQAGACNLDGGEEACVITGIDALFGCESEDTEDLFQCEHWDGLGGLQLEYAFGVAPGNYMVNLFFANVFSGTALPDQRRFDIFIEGIEVYDEFDQVAAAGGSGVAVVRSAFINVQDGTLDIAFGNVLENPTLKAIEVLAMGECVDAADCDNGNACDGAETCQGGACVTGAAPNCSDGNVCNGLELCLPEAGCVAGTPINCDDGVGCTADICSTATGACTHAPDHSTCSDGEFCNGSEICDLTLDCKVGEPPSCNDGPPCTTGYCDEAENKCAATTDDTVCDDAIDCTVDTCQEETGCSNVPADALCEDADACNGAETCIAGSGCSSGTPPLCDDANPCTTDSCAAATGCTYDPNDLPCEDGDDCTTADACSAGSCVGGPPLDCDDQNACTLDQCVTGSGCVTTPVGCDDANLCTTDSCDATSGCAHAAVTDGESCDDAEPCNGTETCQTGLCVSANPLECDDGEYCNGLETCASGVGCQSGESIDCDDQVSCTHDGCDETADACENALDDSICDNGLSCDGAEICDPALGCQMGSAPSCDDQVDCTIDSCDELNGCTSVPDHASCDDGLYCNGLETCDAVLDCTAGATVNCDDGIDCTFDACDETSRSCENVVDCPDGEICNLAHGQCEMFDPRICIAAATHDLAFFQGAMTTGSQFALGDDSDPSADSLIGLLAYADSAANAFSGGSGDQVIYTVDLPSSGPWWMWARMYYPGNPGSNQANSFLLSVDGGVENRLGNNKDFFQRWHWDGDGTIESGPPQPLALGFLGAGTHQITVAKREATPVPPRLDVLCFSPDPSLIPSDAQALDLLGAGVTSTTMPIASTTTTTLPMNCFVDADCDDGAFCNGAEICDALIGCRPGTPPGCQDGIDCTVDTCNEVFDLCVHSADHGACADGDLCNGAETCTTAGCLAGTPPDCADGNPCTDDSCTAAGGCVNAPNSAPCTDGVACTSDFCSAGACMSIDACPAGTTCNAVNDLCELPPDPRVWIAAAADTTAAFSGLMTTSTAFADGDEVDASADSLLPVLVYAGGGVNAFGGGSGDEVSYLVEIPTTGLWYLWARMYYPGAPGSNAANSFLVSVDGGPRLKVGNNKDFFQKWHWDGDGSLESGPTEPLGLGLLAAGVHEIIVEKREASPAAPRLDALMLTPDPTTPPTDADALLGLALP
ncbi:MAG: malectin domain-containing carbohydrate-binding protein [Candidatus Binatia bacterium]